MDFMPRLQEKGKKERCESSNDKAMGQLIMSIRLDMMRMDANDKSPGKGTFGGPH